MASARRISLGLAVALVAVPGNAQDDDAPVDLTADLHIALMGDAALAERDLARSRVGTLPLPDGRVVVSDPLVRPDLPPLVRALPPDDYDVSIVHAPGIYRNAFGVLHVEPDAGPSDIARWEMALVPGQDVTTLEPGEFFGFGVDAGTAGFMASDYGAVIGERSEAEAFTTLDLFNAMLRDGPVSGIAVVERTEGPGSRPERVRLIGFHSGWGDGSYPAYWALDGAGDPLALVIDLFVLEDGVAPNQ